MKNILILLVVSLITAQTEPNLFDIETRTRVLDGNILQVVVQVNNNSELAVTGMEGFMTVYDTQLAITDEKRLVLIKKYEPELKAHGSISRSLNFNYEPKIAPTFVFHISKIQFTGDHRIYTYHPTAGLIRID